jgi:hypothetical protein
MAHPSGKSISPVHNSSICRSPPEASLHSASTAWKYGQIIYLLMDNKKIRVRIPILSKKAVLLLGRFTEGSKEILDMIRTELRKLEWLPMVFDFERPSSRNLTETVTLLAGWSRFIISDLTKPGSNPLELQQIIPQWKIPLLPIIQEGENEFAMFRDLSQYPWVCTHGHLQGHRWSLPCTEVQCHRCRRPDVAGA